MDKKATRAHIDAMWCRCSSADVRPAGALRKAWMHASACFATLAFVACGGTASSGFGTPGTDGGTFDTGQPATGAGLGDAGPLLGQGDSGGAVGTAGDGGSTTVTTIYADTDTSLYTLDPQTNEVALVGAFSGFGGGEGDDLATDVAVDAEGDVYINSESAVYKAVLPTGAGTVALTNRLSIALRSNQSFYALAFAPPGVLGAGETLVGGDNGGELWSIDPTSGATRDLGSFGPNPSRSGDILSLSGDIVFYLDSTGTPTGLATIRSCSSGGGDCTSSNDYLAGIDMTALASAYASGTPATSLLAGVYGGGASSVGSGTGFGELFGLGAWEGKVFGFGHNPADLITIGPSGVGALVASNDSSGWAGAGVSTKVTITVQPPPTAK